MRSHIAGTIRQSSEFSTTNRKKRDVKKSNKRVFRLVKSCKYRSARPVSNFLFLIESSGIDSIYIIVLNQDIHILLLWKYRQWTTYRYLSKLLKDLLDLIVMLLTWNYVRHPTDSATYVLSRIDYSSDIFSYSCRSVFLYSYICIRTGKLRK